MMRCDARPFLAYTDIHTDIHTETPFSTFYTVGTKTCAGDKLAQLVGMAKVMGNMCCELACVLDLNRADRPMLRFPCQRITVRGDQTCLPRSITIVNTHTDSRGTEAQRTSNRVDQIFPAAVGLGFGISFTGNLALKTLHVGRDSDSPKFWLFITINL
jgi:hypothetical protein